MPRPERARPSSPSGTRLALALALLVVVPSTCWAQAGRDPNVPLDTGREQLSTELAIMVATLSLGTLSNVSCGILASNLNYQEYLRTCRMLEDDALLNAYTQAQMVDLQKSLRQATAASRYLVQKLEADQAYYVEQNGFLNSPTWEPRTGAEREMQQKYNAIRDFLAANRDKILGAEGPVLTIVTDVQKALQPGGGYAGAGGGARLKLESGRVVEALVNYQKIMTEVMQDYQQRIVLTEASPQQQLKISFYNNSKYTPREWANADDPQAAAVFFVRIWERSAAGEYPEPREDTRSWIPIYPEGLNVKVGDGTSAATVVTLPNEVWLPAKLRDRIEVRVATFGMHRNRIRFMPLDISGNLRPDRITLSRGFYFHGYDFARPTGGTIISHWYPINEDYQWRFEGGWAPGNSAADPQFVVPATPADLEKKYEEIGVDMTRYAKSLTLVRDQVMWTLPASFDSVKGDPNCAAFVSGTAVIEKKGPASDSPLRDLKETVTDAPFSFTMRTW